MPKICRLACFVVIASVLTVSSGKAAQIWVTGVLEENAGKYSRCVAVSEDGTWVVGNSKKTEAGSGSLVTAPFSWSRGTGLRELTTSASGNNTVTGCAIALDGSLLACGNIGGMARKWQSGAWSILPAPGGQQSGHARTVFGITYDRPNDQMWIVGSSLPATNQKAYRYSGDGTYIDFWGYYQDAVSVAYNGWAVGKNDWGDSQENPDWRYDKAIFIFNWNVNCAGGGNCGWDQLNRFAGYGDSYYYKSQATAINPTATWAAGYATYNKDNLGLFHAFKWRVPQDPQLAPVPAIYWERPIDLGVLGAGDTLSYAYCVSDNPFNPIIGGLSYGSFKYAGYKAVYWDNAGCHDLYAELQAAGLNMGGWASLSRISGISADGRVMVGYGMYDDDNNPGTDPIEMGYVVDLAFVGPVPPVITQQPQAQYRCYGSPATFTVTATGGGMLSYQWQKNRVDLADGGHCSGATSHILTISPTDNTDLANYRCVVTNADGTATSNEAALTLASGVPGTPADATPSAIASDKIIWKWTDVSGEIGYRVKDVSGNARSSDLSAGTIQWQEANLAANTGYQRRVFAFNDCGESAGSVGQTRYTWAMPATYGTGTASPTVTSDQGFSMAGLSANAPVSFFATNGFGDGPARVGQFGYLWDQAAGDPSSWSGEQAWTGGTLVKQLGASGNWYLHLRSYNNDSSRAANSIVFNMGPYTVGGSAGTNCVQNPGFEDGFTGGVGNGWTKFTYAGAVTCSDSTSQYHTGTHSQAISSSSAGNEGGVYQQFSTVPGQTYTVRIWFKCSNNQICGYFGVDPLGGTNPVAASVDWASVPYTTWTVQTWSKTAQAGKITVYLDAAPTGSTSGTVWVDDAEPACSVLPNTPTDGVAQALSTTSIRWKWTDVANETGYRVKAVDGTAVSPDLTANTVQWDETTGILPNVQYTRRIVAFSTAGESGPSAGQTRYSLIETPTGVSFGNVTTTSIDATATGSLSNLGSASSGVRVANTTAATTSPWQSSKSAWTSANLTANTPYNFVARARNGEAVETADSPVATMWTLSVPPTAQTITSAKNHACINGGVVWTTAGGFGPGTVHHYRYAWDNNPTYTFTGNEPVWDSGTLTVTAAAAGTWYLHVRGYNGADVANGSFDYAIQASAQVKADLDSDCDVDADDVVVFRSCSGGPNVTIIPEGCPLTPDGQGHIAADYDADGDVDQSDFGQFQRCITGPEAPAAPECY